MSILVVGSVALDTLRFPGGNVHERVLGGSASYFSLAASLFSPVRLVGVVGGDFSPAHMELLRRHQVDLAGLEIVKDGETFFWDGEYLDDMNERVTHETKLGVFGAFAPKLPAGWESSDDVFCGNIDPELQAHVLAACGKRRFAALDTMNLWINIRREALLAALRRVDLLFLNDSEAKLLTGAGNLLTAAREVLRLGPARVVIKRGEYGVFMLGPDGPFAAPALPLDDAVDPTGAGDSFAGGFFGSLSQEPALDEAAFRRACVAGTLAASFTCQGIGVTRLAEIGRPDYDRRLAEFVRLTRLG
ncbi:MAG: sugar kinase [Myxococcales bacterium]|nr:sugar kinase [Myxococcales bacterium]